MIGYDKLRLNQGLLLDLQFRETTGTQTKDWAKPYHDQPTLSGAPAWAVLGNDLTYLSFDPANPDRVIIQAADCVDLDFTTTSFSGGAWIYPDAYGNRFLFNKVAVAGTEGWAFWISGAAPYLAFSTYNAGPASQTTYGGNGLATSAWQFVSFSRSGASAAVYLNGVNVTVTNATHINPATSAAVDFTIGTTDGGAAGWYDGRMWRARVWNRQLAAWEMKAIYEAERDLFGV
jgi:hypothetical protein